MPEDKKSNSSTDLTSKMDQSDQKEIKQIIENMLKANVEVKEIDKTQENKGPQKSAKDISQIPNQSDEKDKTNNSNQH